MPLQTLRDPCREAAPNERAGSGAQSTVNRALLRFTRFLGRRAERWRRWSAGHQDQNCFLLGSGLDEPLPSPFDRSQGVANSVWCRAPCAEYRVLDYLVQDWREFGRREGAQSLRAHVASLPDGH
jgi:hypothetical protein